MLLSLNRTLDIDPVTTDSKEETWNNEFCVTRRHSMNLNLLRNNNEYKNEYKYKYKNKPLVANRIYIFFYYSKKRKADGSFMIIIKKQPKIPYRLYPCFTLTQNKIDITMMKAIHRYLGVGRLVVNRDRVDIVVSSIDDILHIILPHFDNYPVLLFF